MKDTPKPGSDRFGLFSNHEKSRKDLKGRTSIEQVLKSWRAQTSVSPILTFSDVHLGATRSNSDELYKFLSTLLSDPLRASVGSIFILGDFFDLCMSTPRSLSSTFIQIYDLLEEFQKQGIPIVYILGNHEIPIIGDYENFFLSLKNEFYSRFKYLKNPPRFIKKDSLAQYILLTTNNNQTFHYSIGNNIYEVKDQLNKNLSGNFIYLLCHGYQFDPNFIKKIGGVIWKKLISSESENLKKIFDVFYNGILRGGFLRRENEIYKVYPEVNEFAFNTMHNCESLLSRIKEREEESQNIVHDLYQALIDVVVDNNYKMLHQFFEEQNISLEYIKAQDLKIDIDFENYMTFQEVKQLSYVLGGINFFSQSFLGKYYLKKRILRFLEEYKLHQITGIIFGHTHDKETLYIDYYANKLNAYNDGAWQNNTQISNYANILSDGTVLLKDY